MGIHQVGDTIIRPQHRLSCHCGSVVLELSLPDGIVNPRRCDCSICRRKGAVVASLTLDAIRIVQGEEHLRRYQFNTNVAQHYFCGVCGIYTHHRRRSFPDQYGYNVGCLEGVNPFLIPDVPVNDGVNHPADRPQAGANMQVQVDDPARPDVHALLEEHLRNMHELSPPESVHALDVSRLKSADITFWSVRDGGELLGCGALKQLTPMHGEIKSMRTPALLRRRGAGRAVLLHILAEAERRGYSRLSLETGTAESFTAAHRLYESVGFVPCGPFGDYKADPHSVFMTLDLTGTDHGTLPHAG